MVVLFGILAAWLPGSFLVLADSSVVASTLLLETSNNQCLSYDDVVRDRVSTVASAGVRQKKQATIVVLTVDDLNGIYDYKGLIVDYSGHYSRF